MRSCSVIEETSDAKNSELLPKRNVISRLEITKHLPNNRVTFKIGRKHGILIKHSCTIDYLVYGLVLKKIHKQLTMK